MGLPVRPAAQGRGERCPARSQPRNPDRAAAGTYVSIVRARKFSDPRLEDLGALEPGRDVEMRGRYSVGACLPRENIERDDKRWRFVKFFPVNILPSRFK